MSRKSRSEAAAKRREKLYRKHRAVIDRLNDEAVPDKRQRLRDEMRSSKESKRSR